MLPRARHRPHALADGARPVQGLHLDAQAERLPLDPHHHRRAAPQRVELQIRTARNEQDRRIRRRGASLYKDIGTAPRPAPAAGHRVQRLSLAAAHSSSMLLEGDNPEEFLEHTKLELFQDQVFCFTPKGD